MSPLRLQHVTIIGVGLLGGSVAFAIRRKFPRVHVAGVGRSQKSLDQALAAGAIDSAHLQAAEPASRSDLVILATPVGAFEPYLRSIAPVLRRGAWVTDVGSTKVQIVRQAAKILGPRGAFIGSHPMAGSEQKGVAFARADLLDNALCIITPTASSPASLSQKARSLWKALGMRVLAMTPQQHDRVVAGVSHLPHALAVLLMMSPRDGDLAAAAGGFRDMTRLAGGDVEMWRDIFLSNRQQVVKALDSYSRQLRRLRRMIAAGDVAAIAALLEAAHRRRGQIGPNGSSAGGSARR